jgi:hypothetical protein
MMKEAFVSLTILMSFTPQTVDLAEDCSKEEFEQAVDDIVNRQLELIEDATGLIVNDIETEIVEKGE